MITITNEDNMAMMAKYPDKHFDLAIELDTDYYNAALKRLQQHKSQQTLFNYERKTA